MTAFYTILKIAALLAVVLLPLIGPKKKKIKRDSGLSRLAINERGFLEPFTGHPVERHPVH
jgi:hypothetical protein